MLCERSCELNIPEACNVSKRADETLQLFSNASVLIDFAAVDFGSVVAGWWLVLYTSVQVALQAFLVHCRCFEFIEVYHRSVNLESAFV